MFSIEFYLLPAPHVIVQSLRETYPFLVGAGLYTFTEAVLGFALGCGGGILAAMAASTSPGLAGLVLPYAVASASIPIVALAPLAIVWFCLVISYSFGLPYSSFLSVHQKNAFMVNSSTLISGVFIGVVAFATYAFGPVGTALAVTLSNVTVQVVRRWYACAIGCERIGETGALAVLVSTIGAYAIGAGLALSLATRLGIFVVSAIAITALTRMRRSPGPTAGEAPTAIERA